MGDGDRDTYVYRAKLAEQAERYDGKACAVCRCVFSCVAWFYASMYPCVCPVRVTDWPNAPSSCCNRYGHSTHGNRLACILFLAGKPFLFMQIYMSSLTSRCPPIYRVCRCGFLPCLAIPSILTRSFLIAGRCSVFRVMQSPAELVLATAAPVPCLRNLQGWVNKVALRLEPFSNYLLFCTVIGMGMQQFSLVCFS